MENWISDIVETLQSERAEIDDFDAHNEDLRSSDFKEDIMTC